MYRPSQRPAGPVTVEVTHFSRKPFSTGATFYSPESRRNRTLEDTTITVTPLVTGKQFRRRGGDEPSCHRVWYMRRSYLCFRRGMGVTMLGSQGEELACLYHKSVQLKSDSLNVGKLLGPNHTHWDFLGSRGKNLWKRVIFWFLEEIE